MLMAVASCRQTAVRRPEVKLSSSTRPSSPNSSVVQLARWAPTRQALWPSSLRLPIRRSTPLSGSRLYRGTKQAKIILGAMEIPGKKYVFQFFLCPNRFIRKKDIAREHKKCFTKILKKIDRCHNILHISTITNYSFHARTFSYDLLRIFFISEVSAFGTSNNPCNHR